MLKIITHYKGQLSSPKHNVTVFSYMSEVSKSVFVKDKKLGSIVKIRYRVLTVVHLPVCDKTNINISFVDED